MRPSSNLNDEPFPNPRGGVRPGISSAGYTDPMSPFTPHTSGPGLNQILGDHLQSDVNTLIDLTQVKADIVALYFSAHWCPPCRMFTPLLSNVYRAAMQQNKSFEIVFATNDRTLADFQQYYAQMPWKAIPFSERARVHTLMAIYGVKGIPSMIILDKFGNSLQTVNVVNMIRQSSEIFLSRLPDRKITTEYIPPQDPAIANITIDDILEEMQDDANLSGEQRLQGLLTIRTLLSNIRKDRANPKFRTIKKENRNISEKVLKYPVFTKMLKLAGFREMGSTFVAPLAVPLPSTFEQVLDMVNALVESLQQTPNEVSPQEPSASPSAQPATSTPSVPASQPSEAAPPVSPEYECEDGFCRRRNEPPPTTKPS
eukprot:Gregarina_sp_Pseudo_9__1360@NODE_1910_length_1259_cov_48_480328_g1771_i0_p1_GENE_NODE_1910_length_1259_cov_48_480328_g1771_i0NODE_1910_length_1259_cov_48_480328_g1771_i0_p1_ORF_typecomplete_len371_score39_27Thioredoxin_8/PF13905_6/1_6e27PUB/PF09409_10/1_2e13AhpCTSA/PF00578_21/2_4e08Thioredoxin/PF00085_20/4_8e07Thioredoxin_9/PF14595_6/0_00017Thioredoxin_9/PF14595_6/3_2e03Redoxin/PF08534_10/1_2e05Thioredoxin_2/PF13098_6/1_8e05TraF/PF13728_6/0_0019MSA2c/PF12238_8/0_061Thioredoxin_7/PF13899_6/0_093D